MSDLKARDALQEIHPYVPGEFEDDAIKLSSNENPYGCSEKVSEKLSKSLNILHYYPDGGVNLLRDALSCFYKIDRDLIGVGAGSDEIIRTLFHAYLTPSDNVVFPEYGFLMYRLATMANGATPIAVREDNYTAQVDMILGAIDENTKIVILANPNNPTGTLLPQSEIRRLVENVPSNILCILDAAYAEYIDDEAYDAGHEFVEKHANVAVLRTFSKIYGLSGLRIGWMHASKEIIDNFNKIRGAFNVPNLSQIAAIEALKDQDFVNHTRKLNEIERTGFESYLKDKGITFVPSHGNFVLVDFETKERAISIFKALKAAKILVRPVGFYNLNSHLRISIGTKEQMDRLKQALDEIL